jgi:hypothetical protein
MLTSNSCIAEIIYGSSMLSITLFTLQNDIKHRVFQDTLCTFRSYLGFLGTALLLYSFTLQALYRYIIVVYPTRISWQSIRVQGTLVCFSWLFCIISPLPWLLMGTATYNVDNQACLLPFQLYLPIICNGIFVYLIPISIIIFIYSKLVRYVHQMSTHAISSTQTLQQARRELVMAKRIVTIISILVLFGLPYTTFMFISFITKPPKYYYRIAILFSNLSQDFIMIVVFKFSRPVMNVLLKFKRTLSNVTQSINIQLV